MKHNPNPNRLRWLWVSMVAAGLATVCAWGQDVSTIEGLDYPIYVGNLVPVLDPFGRPMRGTHLAADGAFQSRVELRTTPDGIVRPPFTNGTSHVYHPLVSIDSFGNVGLNAFGRDSGLFCFSLNKRPDPNTVLFGRVYNAPTVDAATFYADSYPVAMPAAADTALVLTFREARPINTNGWAYPGDPFTVSHAELLGIDDRRTDDYDGDGFSNWHEWLAGTAPDDPDSNLSFQLVRRERDLPAPAGTDEAGEAPVRVRWRSVPGKRYQLEYVPTLLGDQVFMPVGPVVTAEPGEYEIDMLAEIPEGAVAGSYRVRLVVE
jgi:hypothetical protein